MPGGATAGAETASSGTFRTRGHERATASVRAMIAGRTPHAILISGPSGIGKTTLALDLAAGLLCDDPEPSARPCRRCRACRLVERAIHPDLHRLAPSGPGDQIRIGRRDAPEEGTVRRLAADLVLLPVEGGARVAILERADRLTDDAQTALLKTLEEPPAGVTIVLCADDEDRLMPTVRSRTARLRLGPVATREIEAILADAGVADPPLAARLARIAGGRPGSARALAQAPAAVAARDEIGRHLLDLVRAPTATRLAAVRDLLARATDLGRALDRAAIGSDSAAGLTSGSVPAAAGRSRSRAKATGASGPSGGSATPPASDGVEAGAGGGDDEIIEDEPGAGRATVPAAERRRAALILVGLWREVARDLLLVALDEERQVRDPAFLDDLRACAIGLRDGARAEPRATLGAFLGRIDVAGELLEANVRPELVVDGLVLAWPRAAG